MLVQLRPKAHRSTVYCRCWGPSSMSLLSGYIVAATQCRPLALCSAMFGASLTISRVAAFDVGKNLRKHISRRLGSGCVGGVALGGERFDRCSISWNKNMACPEEIVVTVAPSY